MIVLNTIKGRGVSYTEGIHGNHNMNISREQMEQGLMELTNALNALG